MIPDARFQATGEALPAAAPESPIARGERLEREGDELVYEGDTAGAKILLGAAIDAYLHARHFEEAIHTCRKLIRVAPDVVRTHFTLAFLLVGRERDGEAREALGAYVQAVVRTRTQSFAIPRLFLLAHVVGDPSFRALIGRLLVDLGAEREGFEMLNSAHIPATTELQVEPDTSERWERVWPIALLDI